jgi:hypothetical protein
MPGCFLKRKRNDATLLLKTLSTSKITGMKKIFFTVLGCLLFFSFQSCLKDKLTHSYTIYTPIYQTKEQVTLNIKSNPAEEIQSPGNLFVYGNYIFLNETDKGVHIIDNTDPSNPVDKAFIDIPGNLDIAVKGNILYADMYQDLVVVDISDPLHAKWVKTLPDVFTERYYGNGFFAASDMVIVGWTKKDTTVELEHPQNYWVYPAGVLFDAGAPQSAGAAAAPILGISGSMARFTIVNDYLYAVDHHTLLPISINHPADPVAGNVISAGFDIETIYPFKNKLFLGSMGGLYIYDISQPEAPVKEGDFIHARACDPVIADDNYAYVTLREGTTCGPANNELEVVDVQDLQAPSLLKSYPMTKPQGLTKDNNMLFVCDDGIKMYDASDPANIVLKTHVTGLETRDAIAWNKNLIVVSADGLYQYDYSNLNDLILRSKLSINR